MYDRPWRGSSPKAEVSLCEFLVFQMVACLCIGNTATERGSGFIQRTPKWQRIKAALMPRDKGTECSNGRRMKPESKGVCATFCYFTGRKYILNLSSTCARASHAAVTCRQLAQPAVVQNWVSSTQYGSWQGSHWQGTSTCRLWSCLLHEVVFWFLSPSEVF